MELPLYPRTLKEMADQMGGRRRYIRNNAPAVPTITMGSAEEMVSTVDEAIGLASSITFVVCCAVSATICLHKQKKDKIKRESIQCKYSGKSDMCVA